MNKTIRILLLLIILVISIYFDAISQYIGNKYNSNIEYKNYKIKLPKYFSIESISQNNRIYMYGIIPNLRSKIDMKKDEKRYIYSYDKNWLSVFINKSTEIFKDNDVNFKIKKNTNILNELTKKHKILKYKNTYIKYMFSANNKFFYIYKNDIRILVLINKVNNKTKLNKALIELLDNINSI